MKFEQIITDLKNQIYHPVYLLSGEEPYFIDRVSGFIEENVLSESEKEFNQTVLYGRDVDVPTIVSYAKRYPMMANYQVLIIKEAQEIKELDALSEYAKAPLETTILVICHKYKKYDKRKSLYKTVNKKGVCFESARLYDSRVPEWINKQIRLNGFSITPKAAMMMADYLGTDLSKISNEIQKLNINLPEGTEIRDVHVEENIGISKDYNVFELQKALGQRNILKANGIINYFAANKKDNPLIMVVALLYSYFSKVLMFHYLTDRSQNNVASVLSVPPFFVNDYRKAAANYSTRKLQKIMSTLREYDLKSKGVGNINTEEGQLMKEMIFKILH